jgi:hypothetical protein
MLMTALITATLAAVVYSLWIRRHTWLSRWEAGASLNIALQGCAVLLMSPWASATLGPPLRRIIGLWNVEDLLGHLCLIVAVTAIIHHGLARLTHESHIPRLFRKHVAVPLRLGVPLLVSVFVIADEAYHPDLFPRPRQQRLAGDVLAGSGRVADLSAQLRQPGAADPAR